MNERDFIIDMVDEGLLDAKNALTMCLNHMSLDDVKSMIEMNLLDQELTYWKRLNRVAA